MESNGTPPNKQFRPKSNSLLKPSSNIKPKYRNEYKESNPQENMDSVAATTRSKVRDGNGKKIKMEIALISPSSTSMREHSSNTTTPLLFTKTSKMADKIKREKESFAELKGANAESSKIQPIAGELADDDPLADFDDLLLHDLDCDTRAKAECGDKNSRNGTSCSPHRQRPKLTRQPPTFVICKADTEPEITPSCEIQSKPLAMDTKPESKVIERKSREPEVTNLPTSKRGHDRSTSASRRLSCNLFAGSLLHVGKDLPNKEISTSTVTTTRPASVRTRSKSLELNKH